MDYKMHTLFGVLTLITAPSWLGAQAETGGSGFSMIFGFVLIFGIFYFLIIRPQGKRAKQHAAFVASIEKGDSVITQAGLYGKVYGVADRVITLEIAPNVRIRVDRQTIASREGEAVEQKSQTAA
jgi:preprotein translocase subunit YajC